MVDAPCRAPVDAAGIERAVVIMSNDKTFEHVRASDAWLVWSDDRSSFMWQRFCIDDGTLVRADDEEGMCTMASWIMRAVGVYDVCIADSLYNIRVRKTRRELVDMYRAHTTRPPRVVRAYRPRARPGCSKLRVQIEKLMTRHRNKSVRKTRMLSQTALARSAEAHATTDAPARDASTAHRSARRMTSSAAW
jgi:hypothetical protein